MASSGDADRDAPAAPLGTSQTGEIVTPSMTAAEWFEQRQRIATDFGCTPDEVPPAVVWFIPHPQPPLTDEDIARAKELAAQFGSNQPLEDQP